MYSYPYDPQRILDKEVEYQGNHAYEGQYRYACTFPRLCFIQLLLGNISRKRIFYNMASSLVSYLTECHLLALQEPLLVVSCRD